MSSNENLEIILKIVAVSDTHNQKPELPEGDLLIHAGDMSSGGTRRQIQRQINWLDRQYDNGYDCVILIAGNHDKALEDKSIFNFRRVIYLENQEYIYKGIKIYGSPVTPTFYEWSFMHNRGPNIQRVWDLIPEDTDILVTHGPPHGIGDLVIKRHAGCMRLLNKVYSVQPTLHIFGHIHEGHGSYTTEEFRTKFINAAIMDGRYNPVNKPIEIEWKL